MLKRRLVLAVLIGLLVAGADLHGQTFTAQIQQFWNQLRTGVLVFTNIAVTGGTISGVTISGLTTTGPTTINTTTTTTSNPSVLVYAGVTAPRTYYGNDLLKSTIVLANAVPRASGLISYYKYAPTDSDASGIQRFASLNYFESGGTQNLSSTLIAAFNRAMHYGTGSVPSVYGGYFDAFNGHAGEQLTTGGNMTSLYGVQAEAFMQSANSTLTNIYGVYALTESDYGVGVTNAYGGYFTNTLANGTPVTNSYGVYTGTISGTNKFSFYASDATAPSVLPIVVGGTGTTSTLTFQTTTGVGTTGSDFIFLNGNNGGSTPLRLVYRNSDGLTEMRVNGSSQANIPLAVAGIGANAALFSSSGVSINTFYTPTGADQYQVGAGQIATNDFGIGNSTRGTTPLQVLGGANAGQSIFSSAAGVQICVGGSTVSFPALKRATLDVQVRTCTDSAYGNLDALAYKASSTAITSGTTFLSNGSGMAVANVGANSCGTSAATIAGNNNAFVITVGATAGTQCRVAFTLAATTEWDCTVTDSTTTIATRSTPVDTTHTDFFGAFVAGDKVTGICFPR